MHRTRQYETPPRYKSMVEWRQQQVDSNRSKYFAGLARCRVDDAAKPMARVGRFSSATPREPLGDRPPRCLDGGGGVGVENRLALGGGFS